MSGKAREIYLEVRIMCNNNGCGNNWWWIIILILLFCNCGWGSTFGGCGCGNWNNNNCDNNCGCC